MTAPPVPSFEERFAALRADWQSQLPQRLRDLQARIRACIAAPHDTAALEELHRTIHTLAGSAGTFGLPALSQRARALENRLEPLLQRPGRTATELAALQPDMEALLAQAGA